MSHAQAAVTDILPGYVPAGLDLPAFAAHTHAFLTEWLGDFTWHGQPLIGALASVSGVACAVEFPDEAGPEIPLWTNPGPTWMAPRPTALVEDRETGQAMSTDPFHDAWGDLLDGYALAGTWLHPDTLWDMDPYAWATGAAAFAVGTRDRRDPAAPRRYDPTLRCDTNDLGVVYFPVRAAFRAPEWIAEGHTADRTSLYVVGTALAEAGVHEAMEMHQATVGQPVWDPHDRDYRLTLAITFADGLTAIGTAH